MGQVLASFISFFGRGGGRWLLIIKLNVNLTNFCQGLMQVNSINGPGAPCRLDQIRREVAGVCRDWRC